MKKAVLIYPHQLFEKHPLLEKGVTVFLVEEPHMFTQYNFHKQKLIFHRSTMMAYKDMLIKDNYDVKYIEYADIIKTENIVDILIKFKINTVVFCDLADKWIHKKITKKLSDNDISYTISDTPLFLTNKIELDSFFLPLLEKNKKFIMKTFYEWQRKRLDVLIDKNGKPVGGKWSYDEDNRQKITKDILIPKDPESNMTEYVLDAKKYIEKHFKGNYGSTDSFFYPISHHEAKKWLNSFLKHKLNLFGPYEDAMTTEGNFLFHSILSPLLNTGLLTPEYVLKETLAYAEKNTVALSSLEGFIRQIIGWREYMRAVYVYLGDKERNGNYFNSKRSIPHSFWQGNTGITPVDDTIKNTLKYAYAHHIPRLMIMGNFMNLCQFKPDEVYRWFMELYIDAYDWVMVPNVYSMALYADGGLITTKPYISGSAYILKMSNYKKGEWSDIWDALFWNFVGIHFDALSKEGRLGFIGVTYKKMTQDKKEIYTKKARLFLDSL